MLRINLDFRSARGIENGLGQSGFGHRERLARTGAADGGDAAAAVHISRVERRGGCAKGRGLFTLRWKRRDAQRGSEEGWGNGVCSAGGAKEPPHRGPDGRRRRH